MNHKNARPVPFAAALFASGVASFGLHGCSSGSGSSDVGNRDSLGPVALASIVGHPVTESAGDVRATVRGGAEVILSASNSYGQDSPILEFDWKPVNAAAQSVQLLTRSATAKSFTVPSVASPSMLQFELTVRDAKGSADSATARIDVEALGDPDRFLTYLLVPGTFRVAASTNQPITVDTPFVVDVALRVAYSDRQNLQRVVEVPVDSGTAAWLAAARPQPAAPGAFTNPALAFDIPRLDLDDINAEYLALPAGDPRRNRILDAFKVDQVSADAVVTLRFPAGSTGDASQAVLFLTDAAGADIGAKPGTSCVAAGAAYECVVPLPNLASAAASVESATTAAVYYDTIDPTFAKTTLTAWLEQNCFDPAARDFGADAHAVYTNNFDLGFGRDMYLKRGTNCPGGPLPTGSIASVVVNYPSLLLAAKRIDPIIAVAMEYSPPAADATAPPFAKFYVFAPDEGSGEMVRVGSANFDARGEKFVPGVCTVCHGGRPAQSVDASQPYPNDGNVGAIFMPWDLDSFLFSGPDGDAQKDPSLPPSTHPFLSSVDVQAMSTYTRANQEAEFRKLNEAVLATYPQDAPVRKVVHDWYGAASTPRDYAANALTGNFRSGHVPAGWSVDLPGNPVQPRELYEKVIAQHCRACHTQLALAPAAQPRVPGLTQDIPTFETFDAFVAEMTDNAGMPTDRIIAPVFDRGVMPLARLTSDRMWVAGAGGERPADLLAAHLGLSATRIPGRPFATITPDRAQYVRGDSVRLDGATGSLFAERFEWALSHAPPPDCPNAGNAFASQAQLIGPQTPNAAFGIDVPGTFTVSLTVANAAGATFAPDPLAITVGNNCPVAATINTTIPLGVGGNTLNLNGFGIATPGDAPHSFELVVAANVDVSIANGIATISCTTGCVQTTPSFFDFRVTDRDGDFAVGRANVTVTAAPQPVALPVTLDVTARTPTFSSTSALQNLSVYNATSGGIGNRTISVGNTARPGSTVSVLADGRTVRYVPPSGFVGTDSFTYTVTDSNPSQPQTDSALVTVRVNGVISFDNDIYSGIIVSRTCASACHGGLNASAQAAFNLSGATAAANWPAVVTEVRQTTLSASGNLLFWPPQAGHTGNAVSGSWGSAATCGPSSDDSPYCALLRWREEGACRIGATGQPIGSTTCPAP